MKRALLIGCLLLIGIFSNITIAASVAPASNIQGTLHDDTVALFSGKTLLNATFNGYPLIPFLNASIIEDMNGFTFFGATSLPHLSTVIVAENIDITTASSLDQLYLKNFDHLHQYSDVNIMTDSGLFILGFPMGGTLAIQTTIPYAVSSSFDLVFGQTPIPFYFMTTQTPLTLQFSGDYAILAQRFSNATITVEDQHGNTLWSGDSSSNYLFIQDSQFQVTQQPPLFLFPISFWDQPVRLTVTPAEPNDIDIPDLLTRLSDQAGSFPMFHFNDTIASVHNIDQVPPGIANGAMVCTQTNDSLMIDGSMQTFNGFGFVRFQDMTVALGREDSGPVIQGNYTLAFLGNYFYNPGAKNSDNGIVFPYMLLLIWIIALSVFAYVFFFLRPTIDERYDVTLRWYALGAHITLAVTGFILLDRIVSLQFGVSALDALIGQGASEVTGVFFGLEFLIWALGFLLLGLPVRLITMSILRVLHIGKGGRGLSAGIGDFSVWVFAIVYLLLFINVFLSAFPLSGLFTAG